MDSSVTYAYLFAALPLLVLLTARVHCIEDMSFVHTVSIPVFDYVLVSRPVLSLCRYIIPLLVLLTARVHHTEDPHCLFADLRTCLLTLICLMSGAYCFGIKLPVGS